MNAEIQHSKRIIIEKVQSIYTFERVLNGKKIELQGIIAGEVSHGIAIDSATGKPERLIGERSLHDFVRLFAPEPDPQKWPWIPNSRRVYWAYRTDSDFETVIRLASPEFEYSVSEVFADPSSGLTGRYASCIARWPFKKNVCLIMRTNKINLAKISIH